MAKKKQQKRSKEDPILNALKNIINSSNMSDHDFVVMMKKSAASARQAFNLSRSVRDPIRLPEEQKSIRHTLALGMAIPEFLANRTIFRISKENYQKILDISLRKTATFTRLCMSRRCSNIPLSCRLLTMMCR